MLHQPIGVGESCPRCLRPGANYDEGITLSEEIGKLVANRSAGPVDATIQFEASICRALARCFTHVPQRTFGNSPSAELIETIRRLRGWITLKRLRIGIGGLHR